MMTRHWRVNVEDVDRHFSIECLHEMGLRNSWVESNWPKDEEIFFPSLMRYGSFFVSGGHRISYSCPRFKAMVVVITSK